MKREQVRELLGTLRRFFRTEVVGGIVLILATVLALVLANSPLALSYQAFWRLEVAVGVRTLAISEPLGAWINDFFMAIFFLVVGLEIKRELLMGELNAARKAMLPVAAALGGMIIPAVFFFAIAHGTPAARGWGVPMATDIAFALGCVRLLGRRVPASLVVFLTALAIIDDLGAILVVALVYSSGLSSVGLAVAAFVTLVLVAMNLLGVRRPLWYLVAGIPLWVAVLKSGIHPTIAGVIVGLCVPTRIYGSTDDRLGSAAAQGDSPASKLEHSLHPWVAFAIVPVFALANAGVSLSGIGISDMVRPTSLGIFLGLFVGKQIGVLGGAYLAVKLKVASLPGVATWRQLYGVSALAGIGFTMSLFIAALAYGEGTKLHLEAKIGILGASLVSALLGVAILGTAKAVQGARNSPRPV